MPLPGKTAFYPTLLDRLAVGKHTFGSAVTQRQTANCPAGAFTAATAHRPGQQVQIDSTPIDVMVLAADGVPVRAGLTIAVDVDTRTICAAVPCCARSAPMRTRVAAPGEDARPGPLEVGDAMLVKVTELVRAGEQYGVLVSVPGSRAERPRSGRCSARSPRPWTPEQRPGH